MVAAEGVVANRHSLGTVDHLFSADILFTGN